MRSSIIEVLRNSVRILTAISGDVRRRLGFATEVRLPFGCHFPKLGSLILMGMLREEK